MSATGSLLTLARDAQAIALANENLKLARKGLKKKPVKTKKLVNVAMKNIVGVNLIKTQAQLSAGL